MAFQLDDFVRHYEAALAKLEQSAVPSSEELLAVLVNRDRIQKELMQAAASPEILLRLLQSDKRLRNWAEQTPLRFDFASWRDLTYPDPQAWWWFLEDATQRGQPGTIHTYERLINRLGDHKPAASENHLSAATADKNSDRASKLSAAPRPGSHRPHLWTRRLLERYLARDQLQRDVENGQLSAEQLAKLSQLDEHFRWQLAHLSQQVAPQDLSQVFHQIYEVRRTLKPSSEAWWWFSKIPIWWWDRLDLAWNTLALVALAISFSLFTDIVTRFLSVNPGILGGFALIGQIILTIIGGGFFTDFGRHKLEQILQKLRFSERFWQEIRFLGAILLLMVVIGLHGALPWVAQAFNDVGFEYYENGDLSQAEVYYQRAIALNPSFSEAHYNLGLLYEDLQNYADARTEYAIAAKGDLPQAYNNWARLEILEENAPEALSLLKSQPVQEFLREASEEDRYVLLKNIGWALQELDLHNKAVEHFRQAIEIEPRWATAYCLLAKSLDELGQSQRAFESWKNCHRSEQNLPDSEPEKIRNPEEYRWILEADERIQSESEGR